jgi:hypothetical protein
MQSSAELEGILIAAKSIGLPFVMALPGLFWARGLLKQNDLHGRRLALAVTAIFVLIGMLAGYLAMNHDQWQFPPAQAIDWLPVIVIIATIVLLPLEYYGAGKRAWGAAQVILVGFSSWVMLPPATIEAGAAKVGLWLIPLALSWLAVWYFVDADSAPRRSGIALTLTAGALGFVVALGSSIVIGSAANSLMAALAAWLAISVIGGWIPLPRALLGSLTLWFGCVLIGAYFYAEISPLLLGTILLGLFSVQLARLAPFDGEQHRWRELATNGLAAALPLIAAVGFAAWSFPRQSNAY